MCLAVLAVPALAAAAPAVTPQQMPDGDIGIYYSKVPVVALPAIPAVWSLASGALPPGLSASPSTGEITGVPGAMGTFTFNLQAKTANTALIQTALSITINPQPQITTSSLPDCSTGNFYLESLGVSGGSDPYTWSVVNGSLPPGLSLEPAGLLMDSPTNTGTYSFTVQVADSAGVLTQKTLSITISQSPVIMTTLLDDAYANALYKQTLEATGGTLPFTWSILTGALPAGLSLGPSGVISGAPTTTGTNIFTIQVTDAEGSVMSRVLSITVNQFISSIVFPAGDVGIAYSYSLPSQASSSYIWSLGTGSLPPGLRLDNSGTVLGTPSATGNYTFSALVSGITRNVLTVNLIITINTLPDIVSSSLPDGNLGTPYYAPLSAIGGTIPYAWSVEGLLPNGLSLNQTTGVISGTPGVSGVFTFNAQVSDSAGGTASQILIITIR